MLPDELNRLRQHYESMTTEELAGAIAHGPDGYSSPAIWQLLLDIGERRGLPAPAPAPKPTKPPPPPGIFERQPSLLTGCLAVAKLAVIAIAILNGLALIVVVSKHGLDPFPSLLVSNLIVLGVVWLAISAFHARSTRSTREQHNEVEP